MKPNFLIVGSAKSGTTSLHKFLSQHPDIFVFPHKEIHYFSLNYDRGMEWYESQFQQAGEEKAVGEGSPTYTEGKPGVVDRIASALPDAKMIYIVRNPVERIESHFVQLLDNGQKHESLHDALHSVKPLLATSFYWERINEFREHYSDENILVLFMTDLVKSPEDTMRKCFEFLDVDSSFQIQQESAANSRESKRVDYPWMAWARKQKIFNDIKWLIPPAFVAKLKPLFRKPLQADVEWLPEDRKFVTESLREDTAQFLEFYGKPKDYWEI